MTKNNPKVKDTEPFVHGEEGTHYACQEMLDKLGGKVRCCACYKHECKDSKSPFREVLKQEEVGG